MENNNGYTPTERRILAVLSDGKTHRRKELEACLYDDMACRNALNVRLTMLRKKLTLIGEDIICHYTRRTIGYRHVKNLVPPNKI